MRRKQITRELIVSSFLTAAAEKSPGSISLTDVSEILEIKKASLYNHFSSREEIYNATLDYCQSEILNATYISDENKEIAKSPKSNALSIFKNIITQYFKLYESEPFFKMYAFVYSEQYFNRKAMEISLAAYKRISDETKLLLKTFKDSGKCRADEKDLKDISVIFSSLLFTQLDNYIAQKKEIIRQNPDAGVGSLFALPTDETSLNKSLKIILSYLESVL